MTDPAIETARERLHIGEISPETAVEVGREHVTDPVATVREAALDLLARACARDPGVGDAVADAVGERFQPGSPIGAAELRHVHEIARHAPDSMRPVVQELARRLVNVDRIRLETQLLGVSEDGESPSRGTHERAMAAAIIGTVGNEAPGVVKPVVPTLVAVCDDEDEPEVTREAMWALVRTGAAEPAVIRPYVAGRVWALDEGSPEIVAGALDDLAHLGAVLPEHVVAVDRIRDRFDHPSADVREAAVRATGRIVGVAIYDGERVEQPLPDEVGEVVDDVTGLLSDPAPEVSEAAVRATASLARVDADAVAPHVRRLDTVLGADSWQARMHAARTLTAIARCDEPTNTLVRDRLCTLLADEDPDVRYDARRGVKHLLEVACGEGTEHSSRFVESEGLAELLVIESFYVGGFTRYAPNELSKETLRLAMDVVGASTVGSVAHERLRQDDTRWPLRLRALEILDAAGIQDGEVTQSVLEDIDRWFADEDADVRERAFTTAANFAISDPARSDPIVRAIEDHVRYTAEDIEDALLALTKLDQHVDTRLTSLVRELCRRRPVGVDDESDTGESESVDDDGGGMSDIVADALGKSTDADEWTNVSTALAAVADATPAALTDVVDPLVGRLVDLQHPDDAWALCRVLGVTDLDDDAVLDRLTGLLRVEGVPEDTQAWIAGGLVVADVDEETSSFGRDRIHTLLERRGTTDATSVVSALADSDPALAAPFVPTLVSTPTAGSLETYVDLAATSDRFVLPVADALVDEWRERDGTVDPTLFDPLVDADWWPLLAARLRSVSSTISSRAARPIVEATAGGAFGDRFPFPQASEREGGGTLDPNVDPHSPGTPDLGSVVRVGLAATLVRERETTGDAVHDPIPHSRWKSVVQEAIDADDPAVRTAGVQASGPVIDVFADGDEALASVVDATADDQPLVGATAVRVAALRARSAECSDAVIERLPELRRGTRPERLAVMEAAGDLIHRSRAKGPRVEPVIERGVHAPERGVRRQAVAALSRGASLDVLRTVDVEPTVVDRLPDDAVRPTIGPLVAAIDPGSLSDPVRTSTRLADALVETGNDALAHVVGERLHAIVETTDDGIRTGVTSVVGRALHSGEGGEEEGEDGDGGEPEDGGEEGAIRSPSTSVGAYWLCRIAGTVASRDPTGAEAFTPVVTDVLERTVPIAEGHPESTALGPVGPVDDPECRRAAMIAAGRSAMGEYADALPEVVAIERTRAGGTDDARTGELADATARYLVRSTPSERSTVIDVLTAEEAAAHRSATVRRLVDVPETHPRLADRLDALLALFDESVSVTPVRPVVAFAVDVLDHEDPTIRRRAVRLVSTLRTERAVAHDEAMMHLLDLLDDPDETVRGMAIDDLAEAASRSYLGRDGVTRIAARYAFEDDPRLATGGRELLHALAVRGR